MNAPGATGRWLRTAVGQSAALGFVVLVAIVVVAAGREAATGQIEVNAADQAIAQLDWPAAIDHAKAAALAFAPLSPWSERGEEQLRRIGHEAETRNDAPTALRAYGALRTAAVATAYPGAGGSHWRGEAEAGLTRIASGEAGGAGWANGTGVPARETASAMQTAFARETVPGAVGLAAVSASGLVLLGGVLWLLNVPFKRGVR